MILFGKVKQTVKLLSAEMYYSVSLNFTFAIQNLQTFGSILILLDNRKCDSFLEFISVTDCSAEKLETEEYGIKLSRCTGQGYDRANVMSGVYRGLHALMKEHGPIGIK